MPKPLINWQLWTILFFEGLASVSLQIITMRQLTPFVGSDVNPTSLIIGFFLASLSLGYWKGGKVSQTANIRKVLLKNFLCSALIMTVGFSTLFLKFTLGGLEVTSFFESLPFIVIFLLFVMCPPVYMMAKTIPIVSNFISANHTGQAAGNSMSLSTVGSVIGSIGTSLVLFFVIGVSATLWAITACIILLAVVSDPHRFKKTSIGLGVVILAVSTFLNIVWVQNHIIKETAYNTYEIIEKKSPFSIDKALMVNNQYASAIYGSEARPSPYIARVRQVLFSHFGYKNSEILVLGAGGFSLSHKDPTNNRYTYVDIDPAIKDVAEDYFLNANINGNFVAQDARQFLIQNRQKFDVIFVDLYTHSVSMPWHTATIEFMKLLKSTINDDGLVAFNIVAPARFTSNNSKRMYKTIQAVFPYCFIDPDLIDKNEDENNVIYACIPEDDEEEPYVDDKAFSQY